MDETLRALNRFGLGARIGERRALREPKEWLRGQLEGRPSEPAGGASMDQISETLQGFRSAQRSKERARLRRARRSLQELAVREARAMLTQRVTTDRPFVERLVAFWSNHLCVSVEAKSQIAALAGHYERTAIRPHVLGRFSDMVLASARHPAMLFYLDNFQSIGPGSRAGKRTGRAGRQRGLNENYARELMELHTVGVDGGYTQGDVEQLARILTGWTVSGLGPGSRRGEKLGFAFRQILHEPGEKTVLGRRYRQAGLREGERAIRDLCAHPATAHFVAGKLVRHFVSDSPPPEAVAEIARVFTESEGDLREVSSTLIELDAAWEPELRKFRTPQDWLVAVFRSFHAPEAPEPMVPLLRQLRHTPWAPSAPKGYGDGKREWADPDSLMNRAELAETIAERLSADGRLDPMRLLDVIDVGDDDPLTTLLADDSISRRERLALAIGGPAFQWR
jgi:uncharacterized protein (DUF1800 family)